MSGGSQHNPNGRQSQLGAGWSPLQVANFLRGAPQAHMASREGVTWHTPTPPPHLYHVPAPSPPDPLQAIKSAGNNSVFRHTATPPELYRHTPTPPDKHLIRHSPSPGDAKAGAPLSVELYPSHLGSARDKVMRPEDLLGYARSNAGGGAGVDLSLGAARGANGATSSPAPAPLPPAHSSHPPSPALSVRDAPTINSLIARSHPHHAHAHNPHAPRHPHAKFDAIIERLVPSPHSHTVIMHSRAAPTPSPPSSNEDSADSCGAPPGSKRKRKPERTIRVPVAPAPAPPTPVTIPAASQCTATPPTPPPPPPSRVSPPLPDTVPEPLENGDASHGERNGPEQREPDPPRPATPPPPPPEPHARRKTRSGSAETIDDIAAMIASTGDPEPPPPDPPERLPELDASATTIDKLESVLASPKSDAPEPTAEPEEDENRETTPQEERPPAVEAATAPRRCSPRASNTEATNVPVESPSEAKPAESEPSVEPGAEPTAASFVEVENQLEKMFAGIEEERPPNEEKHEGGKEPPRAANTRKRRKSAVNKGERKAARRSSRASTGAPSAGDEVGRNKLPRNKPDAAKPKKALKDAPTKDAYDSGSNASSGRSRGPYIQIRGPRDSPVSVSVMNASTGEEEGIEGGGGGGGGGRRKDEFRNGLRARGLHASTLGLRYDATTADASWVCAFCERGPHAAAMGDLFGPYALTADCDEYRALDELTRKRYTNGAHPAEVWFHEPCAVWAPGVVAAGARVWGLAAAVWGARGARCGHCARPTGPLACAHRACRARTHYPCARAHWTLHELEFRALCPRHTH